MKKIALLVVCLIFTGTVFSQEISPELFSINAWMPDTLGDVNNCSGAEIGMPCHLNGKMYESNYWELIKQSGVKLVRFGGEAADENKPTMHQYIKLIDSVRFYGMEPILQVPYNNNYYTADTAAAIVKYINVTMARNVKYWSIGNEPDISPPFGYGYNTASPIAKYIKAFSIKMKAVDSTIITLGPELKFCNNNDNLINDLTTPNGLHDITGLVPGHTYPYIDILTFHFYPFDGSQQYRQVVTNLTGKYQLSQSLDSLNDRLQKCNLYHQRNENPIKVAITEAHVNYKNSQDSLKKDVNAQSFLAGQFWADLLGVAMEKKLEFVCFWSTVEKSLGYISESTGDLRPTYHHFKLMANHFNGSYSKPIINQKLKDFKVIATYNDGQIAVMILNQKKKGTGYQYAIHIGEGKILSGNGVSIKISDVPLVCGNFVYTDYIADESTSLIIFSRHGEVVKKIDYQKGDAQPRLIEKLKIPLIVNAGISKSIKVNQLVTLTAGEGIEGATYFWYEADSKVPLNEKSASSFKVLADRNKTYRLITAYEDFVLEELVFMAIEAPVENLGAE
jgi:hypothetical protein